MAGAVLKKPANELTVVQLQRWLKCCRLNEHQELRDELVDQVEAAMGQKLPIDINIGNGIHFTTKGAIKPKS